MRPTLSTSDVAGICGTTDQHIRKLARLGKIPHYRIGGLLKFAPDEVQTWLEDRHVTPAGDAA